MLKIKVFENSNLIGEFDVNQPEFIIGRSNDCDIILGDHPGISRKHARVTFHQGEYLIEKISQAGKLVKDGESISSHQITDETVSISIPPYIFKFDLEYEQANESVETNSPVVEAKNIFIHEEKKEDPALPEETLEEEDDVFGDDEATSIATSADINFTSYFKIFKNEKYLEDLILEKNVILFGRSKTADFTIESAKSSRKQFTIIKKKNIFFIKDLGSANGSFLNKQQLPANQEIELKSGDVIHASEHKFIFEIKDPDYNEKIKSLALNDSIGEIEDIEALRSNALAIDDSFDRQKLDSTIESSGENLLLTQKENRTKKIRLALVFAICAIGVSTFLNGNKDSSLEMASKAREAQRIKELELQAVDHFNLALRFYNQNEFERCLNEIEAFDDVGVVPADIGETSELRVQCEVEKERIQREQDDKRKLKKQRELTAKVEAEIAKCEPLVPEGLDVIKDCLSLAESLDPTNERVNSLIDEAQAVDIERERLAKQKANYRARVAKGNKLYKKAEQYDKNGDWKRAIKTFDKYSKSSYPDPKKLKKQAKRNIASIRSRIDNILSGSISKATSSIKNEDYKSAVLATREGLKIDRDHEELLKLQENAEKELNSQLRKLYQESIIDEDFGQIEQAKQNWKKIIEQGVPGTNYYEKARKKLKNFGDG